MTTPPRLTDRAALARHGMHPADLSQAVEALFQGLVVGEVVEGGIPSSVAVRFPDSLRSSPERLDALPVTTPAGDVLPLGAVADLRRTLGPSLVRREDVQRVAMITANIEGADLAGTVERVRRAVDAQVEDVQDDPFQDRHRELFDAMYERYEAMRAGQAADGGRTVLLSLIELRDLTSHRDRWHSIGELNDRWADGRAALLHADPRPEFEAAFRPLLREILESGRRPREVLAKYGPSSEDSLELAGRSPFLFHSPAHYTRLGHRLVGEALFETIAGDLEGRGAFED